jgi:MFS family permease
MKRTHGLGAWYLNSFLHDFVPIYPLYAVMFGDHGVEPYALSVLLSVWVIASLLLEVPSGALADKYPRKRLLIVGGCLKGAAYATWLLFPSFEGFLLGFVLWGTGGALRSGTWEALLHDTLAERGEADSYAKVYGRLAAVRFLAVGLSMLAGGALIAFGYGTVLAASTAMPVAAALVAARGIREVERRQPVREESYLALLRGGLREAATNPMVVFIVLVSSTLLCLPEVYDEYVGPFLLSKGYPRDRVAYWFGASFVAAALGNALGHRLRNLSPTLLFGMLAASGVAILLAAHARGWIVPGGIVVFYFAFSVPCPLVAARLQEAIRSESRATVTSVNGMIGAIGGIVYLQAFGLGAQTYGFATATSLTGVVIVALSLLFGILARVLTGPRLTSTPRLEPES